MAKTIKNVDLIVQAQAGCERSKAKLIEAYRPMIARLARKHGYRVEFEDAIQQGSIGLLEALPRFDIDKGIEFATYASHWVAESIRQAQRGSLPVKIPGRAQIAQEAARIMTARRKLEAMGEEPAPHAIARVAGFAAEMIDEIMARTLLLSERATCSIDDAMNIAGSNDSPDHEIDFSQRRAVLAEAANCLNARERLILIRRVAANDEPATLEDLSQSIGVSRERIRQIEVQVVKKLNKRLNVMGFTDAHIEKPKTYRRRAA